MPDHEPWPYCGGGVTEMMYEWKPRVTMEEFFERYAQESGYTVEVLEEIGCAPRPCRCSYAACRGWQMSRRGRKSTADPLAAEWMESFYGYGRTRLFRGS